MCNELTSICIETTLYRNDRTPGLEFYGEQGIEGIHSEFYTQSQHFDHVKKKGHEIASNPCQPPHCHESGTGRESSQT